MFAFDRSAAAVLLPLALLLGVALWSRNAGPDASRQARSEGAIDTVESAPAPVAAESGNQTVAANLPSR